MPVVSEDAVAGLSIPALVLGLSNVSLCSFIPSFTIYMFHRLARVSSNLIAMLFGEALS